MESGGEYLISDTPFSVDGVLTTTLSLDGKPWFWPKEGQTVTVKAGENPVYLGTVRTLELPSHSTSEVTLVDEGNPYWAAVWRAPGLRETSMRISPSLWNRLSR